MLLGRCTRNLPHPNQPDDPQYIVRLVGRVVRVSLETVRLVNALPPDFGG